MLRSDGEPEWSWREVVACLPSRVARMARLAQQKQYFLDVETAAILMRIAAKRLRMEAELKGLECISEMALPDCVNQLLAVCLSVIGQCDEFEKAGALRATLSRALDDLAFQNRVITVRGPALILSEPTSLYEPIEDEKEAVPRREEERQPQGFDWQPFFSSEGSKFLLPEILGIVKNSGKDLRFMAEMVYEVQLADIELTARVLNHCRVDRAILVSRVPLSRIRERMSGSDQMLRAESGKVAIQLVEWDEPLDEFTEFFPGRSFADLLTA